VTSRRRNVTPGDWPKAAKPLRYLALRIRKKQGRLFAAGYDTKYLAVPRALLARSGRARSATAKTLPPD
jgi:hypothetical protein